MHEGASFDVAAHPKPTGREEAWRFTPLRRLRGLLDEPTGETGRLNRATDLPAGVTVTEIGADEARALRIPEPVDRAAALAVEHAGSAVLVDVPADTELSGPIRLTLSGDGTDTPVYGHLVLRVGRFSTATVVLEHTGTARYDAAVSVLVGDGARLDLVDLALWDRDATHLAHTGIRLGRDAAYRGYEITLGGDLVRKVATVAYDGPGGDAELRGLYFADPGQHLEHRLFVDHAVPRCRSNVHYNGALQGDDAHTVWIGDVLIRPEAVGTDTYELNRNLVLTDGARADSVPNLEIETGEVAGAGHASATGRFDDEHLFYLMSRGIAELEARRLVVRGFFAELFNRIPLEDVRDRLTEAVEARLQEKL